MAYTTREEQMPIPQRLNAHSKVLDALFRQ